MIGLFGKGDNDRVELILEIRSALPTQEKMSTPRSPTPAPAVGRHSEYTVTDGSAVESPLGVFIGQLARLLLVVRLSKSHMFRDDTDDMSSVRH